MPVKTFPSGDRASHPVDVLSSPLDDPAARQLLPRQQPFQPGFERLHDRKLLLDRRHLHLTDAPKLASVLSEIDQVLSDEADVEPLADPDPHVEIRSLLDAGPEASNGLPRLPADHGGRDVPRQASVTPEE